MGKKEIFYVLDVMILNWLRETSGISLGDISKHLSEESILSGEFGENFVDIMLKETGFGEGLRKVYNIKNG